MIYDFTILIFNIMLIVLAISVSLFAISFTLTYIITIVLPQIGTTLRLYIEDIENQEQD